MTIHIFAFAALLPLMPAWGDDASSRARLIGAWQQDEPSKGISISFTETKTNALHITTSQGDQKLSEIECKPTGVECDGMSAGKKVKIVMYFSGPALVQLETAGADVTKRQMAVAEQTDTLELVVSAITGNAKAETVRLKRMPSTAKQ